MSAIPETCVVQFTASWCGPCQKMKPFLKEIEKASVPIVTVDIDADHDNVEKFSVSGVPYFVFRCDGEVRDTLLGADENAFRKKYEELSKKKSNQIRLPFSSKAEIR